LNLFNDYYQQYMITNKITSTRKPWEGFFYCLCDIIFVWFILFSQKFFL
jgi:hypothetical protein